MLLLLLLLLSPGANANPARELHDLPYAPGRVLDAYLPAETGKALPAVVLFHGGCFRAGDKSDLADLGRALAQRGFAAFSVNYQLATPTASSFPGVLDDLQQLVEWVRKPRGLPVRLESGWLAAWGESSGGTLAGYVGTRALTTQDQVAHRASASAVVDFFGRTDMLRPEPPGPGTDCAAVFLLGSRKTTPVRYRDASVRPGTGTKPAAFLIVHGSADPQVETWHARHLDALLKEVGAASQVLILEGQGHEFQGEPLARARAAGFRFLSATSSR